MDKIIDYALLVSESEQAGKEVQNKIKEGWQPFGAPFAYGKENAYIVQAIVKYELQIKRDSLL